MRDQPPCSRLDMGFVGFGLEMATRLVLFGLVSLFSCLLCLVLFVFFLRL